METIKLKKIVADFAARRNRILAAMKELKELHLRPVTPGMITTPWKSDREIVQSGSYELRLNRGLEERDTVTIDMTGIERWDVIDGGIKVLFLPGSDTLDIYLPPHSRLIHFSPACFRYSDDGNVYNSEGGGGVCAHAWSLVKGEPLTLSKDKFSKELDGHAEIEVLGNLHLLTDKDGRVFARSYVS